MNLQKLPRGGLAFIGIGMRYAIIGGISAYNGGANLASQKTLT